jgi:hypothetical protein
VHLKVGQILVSATDITAVIVIRAPAGEHTLTCGGIAMVDAKSVAIGEKIAPESASAAGTQLGKRYADTNQIIEVLCTKPGPGSLALDGEPLSVKVVKPLPASD